MDFKQNAELALKLLLEAKADKGQVFSINKQTTEFNVEAGKMSLLRTLTGDEIRLQLIKNNKRATISSNLVEESELKKLANDLAEIAAAGIADEAYSIAPVIQNKKFERGPQVPEIDKLYERVQELVEETQKQFPETKIEQLIVCHTLEKGRFLNSSGVDFEMSSGHYDVSFMFTSKRGTKISSFDFIGFSTQNLNEKFMSLGGTFKRLKESAEHIEAQDFSGKFEGELLIAPNAFFDFLMPMLEHLRDNMLISGSSRLKDKLGQKIVSDLLTLYVHPQTSELAINSFFNMDGFEEKNMTLIENGKLNSFLLSQYGSNKTGLKRSESLGQTNFIVPSGKDSYESLIKNTKKGILLNRFSGGMPNTNGDFSGIAKNSFYIEDGKILYPIKETMISGNLFDVLNSITHISKERLDNGSSILPWMKSQGVTISGK